MRSFQKRHPWDVDSVPSKRDALSGTIRMALGPTGHLEKAHLPACRASNRRVVEEMVLKGQLVQIVTILK